MKKEIKEIVFKDTGATEKKTSDISMLSNYTHFKFCKHGIILTSNKGIGLPKLFINKDEIAYFSFN